MLRGFINDEHRAAFEAARVEYRRGGALAACCGARTRAGGMCQMSPLKGHTRCLRHAGPHAARRHRDQHLCELAVGRLDPEIFIRAEARRYRNRLQRVWKSNPWASRSTIDLGEHEEAFRAVLAGFGWHMESMPPGVLDWARWRFRRTHLDRRDPAGWGAALTTLRGKLEAAGPPREPEHPTLVLADPVHMVASRLSPWSRRRRADISNKAQATPRARRAARQAPPPQEADVLWSLFAQHRRDLAPVLALCQTDEERLRVAAVYRDLIAPSAQPTAARAWGALLRDLSADNS